MNTQVKVGQIWSDHDTRFRNTAHRRWLRVDAVDDRFATCTNTVTGRITRLSIKRMRPTSTGYKLEKDVE